MGSACLIREASILDHAVDEQCVSRKRGKYSGSRVPACVKDRTE